MEEPKDMSSNPVTSKSQFERFIVSQCCFFFTLRAGSLVIGIFQLIVGLLWLIGGLSAGNSVYAGLISTLLMISSGVLIIMGIKKEEVKFIWYAVYLNLIIGIWLLIFTIILFATLHVGLAISSIINALVVLYFAAVLRSYAFELESGPSATTNPA